MDRSKGRAEKTGPMIRDRYREWMEEAYAGYFFYEAVLPEMEGRL